MRPRFIEISLGIAVALLALIAVWLSATGIEQFSMYIVSAGLAFIVFLLGSVWFGWCRFIGRPVYPAVLSSVAIFTILVSVASTQWPLRITYSLSRSAFNAAAQSVRKGEDLILPRRVGLFTIRKAEVSYSGVVCLWTQPAAGGNTGFVQCGRDHVPFNLWSMVKLDDGWQFISED
jgi:hypothetical protein